MMKLTYISLSFIKNKYMQFQPEPFDQAFKNNNVHQGQLL